jgi:hypothetical protein
MNTVIFKWNPSFSSYSMSQYLYDLISANQNIADDFNWSVWDYEKIHEGDRYYWLKLGKGAVGIVGRGIITSNPYEGEDWSGKGRKTYYVDFDPEVMLNPDAVHILYSSILEENIKDFDWNKGHSGLILNDTQSECLEKLWHSFIEENRDDFEKKSDCKRLENDYIYWKK